MQVKVETTELIKQSEDIVQRIVIPEIKTSGDYDLATQQFKIIRNGIKVVKEHRMNIRRRFDSLKEESCKPFDIIIGKLENSESKLNDDIKKYDDEQDEILRKQEEKLKKEQERKAAELRKRAESAIKEETKERLAEEAEQTESITPIIIKPKSNNVTYATAWKWRFKEPNLLNDPVKRIALLKYLLDKQPHLVALDIVALNKYAVSTKGTNPLEYIQFYPDKSLRTK